MFFRFCYRISGVIFDVFLLATTNLWKSRRRIGPRWRKQATVKVVNLEVTHEAGPEVCLEAVLIAPEAGLEVKVHRKPAQKNRIEVQ